MNSDSLINVLSYHTSRVGVKTKDNEYIFPASDGESPSIIPMTKSEIQYIASSSKQFKIGLLSFEDDEKDDMYNFIRLSDWKDILTTQDIEDIILNPTMDGLQKLIDIQENQLFERVRGVLVSLENAGADITTKVKNVVNKRYEEIRAGKIKNTEILLRPKDVEIVTDPKVAALEIQLAEMKAMMEKMMESKADAGDNPTEAEKSVAEVEPDIPEAVEMKNIEPKEVETDVPKKSAGRPKKK